MLLSFKCARPEGDRAAKGGRWSLFLAALFKSLDPAIHLKVFIHQSSPPHRTREAPAGEEPFIHSRKGIHYCRVMYINEWLNPA